MVKVRASWVALGLWLALGVALCGTWRLRAEDCSVRATPEGVAAAAGDFGKYVFAWPRLLRPGGEEKPLTVKVAGGGDAAEIHYGSGVDLAARIEGGKVAFKFASFPEGVEKFVTDIVIPNRFAGGKWQAGGVSGEFPFVKPVKPHLYQGNAREFTFADGEGRAMTVIAPDYSFLQLQDSREWNWEVYQFYIFTPLTAGTTEYALSVRMGAPAAAGAAPGAAPAKAAASGPRVDALGQAARRDFPGKAKDAAELAADVPGQEAFFAAFAPAELDEFGGLPGSGEKLGLKKTGFFHVERHGERWLLVDPAGNAFFQLGVCCVAPHNDATLTRGRESAFAWLPEREGKFAAAWHPEPFWNGQAVSFYTANLIRKFGDADPDKHLERMIGRLRRAGFNSHGAWSRVSPVSRRLNWPYTAFLPIEQWVLGQPMLPGVRGMFDPFAPATRAAVEKRFAEVLPQAADDPLLIGYFLENEQGLEDLPRAVAALSGEHACKQRLAAWLEKKYGDVAAFNRAWGLSAPAFAEVAARPLPLKTPAAFADMGEFAGLFLDAYHGMLRELFDKYDRNHMLIGGRWQPGTANSEILCRSAGKYMDVISVNYYAYGIDEAFVRRLYRWSGEKPMLWSEFHYGSGRDSGLPGRMDVGSQEARGLAYRNYVEGAAALGFVVGTQWFQCIDEPLTGRYFEEYNGENYNIGLFSVVDRPYREVLTAMAATHARIYDVWLNGAAPYRFEHPLFSPKARAAAARRAVVRRVAAPLAVDGQMDGWPNMPPELIGSDRTVMGVPDENLGCSFKLAFDEKFLYVFAQIQDATPLCNRQRQAMLWNGDAVELFIGGEELEKGGALLPGDRQVLLSGGGAGMAPSAWVVGQAEQPEIKVAAAPAADGKGYALEAAIPWAGLGLSPKGGEKLRFDLGIGNNDEPQGNRTAQMMWNGADRNSTDRTGWGYAELDK